MVIDLVWACSRCIFTTVDPTTGEKDANMEPYKTLSNYRQQQDKKVYFAQNLVPRNEGIIRIGDKVEILETRDALVTEGDMLKAAGLL